MQIFRINTAAILLAICAALTSNSDPALAMIWQGEDDTVAEQDDKKSEKDEDEEPVISTDTLKTDEPKIDDRFLRFSMWDGTIVSGVVSISAIDIETEFGSLQIPIGRLVDFRPGLVSLPELKIKVDGLVEKLGDREFKVRESAHRELVTMGPILASLLSDLDDGGDAERKKHLVKIKEEVQSMIEEDDDEYGQDSDSQNMITRGDRVQTPDFSIVGKLVQQEFQVKSKIGDLRIRLSDVKRADRGVAMKAQSLRKTLAVSGMTFFQKKPISTKIRVSKGDRIKITASGIVQWKNWSQTASADGLPNQGNWNGISNGSLAARIGNDGPIFGVGSDHSFKADRAGVLYLGIAMPDNYVNNKSYRWIGKFKTKIKVEPAN